MQGGKVQGDTDEKLISLAVYLSTEATPTAGLAALLTRLHSCLVYWGMHPPPGKELSGSRRGWGGAGERTGETGGAKHTQVTRTPRGPWGRTCAETKTGEMLSISVMRDTPPPARTKELKVIVLAASLYWVLACAIP